MNRVLLYRKIKNFLKIMGIASLGGALMSIGTATGFIPLHILGISLGAYSFYLCFKD